MRGSGVRFPLPAGQSLWIGPFFETGLSLWPFPGRLLSRCPALGAARPRGMLPSRIGDLTVASLTVVIAQGVVEMPRGDKSSYTAKQKRKADHIEEGYEKKGVSKKEAGERAWRTVNKQDKGGKRKSGGSSKKRSSAKKSGSGKRTSSGRKTARKQSSVAKKSESSRKRTSAKKSGSSKKRSSGRKSTSKRSTARKSGGRKRSAAKKSGGSRKRSSSNKSTGRGRSRGGR